MFMRNAIVSYSLLLFSPKEKNNFESLGRKAKTSGDTAIRRLQSAEKSLALLGSMIQKVFKNKKKLYLVIDDTLIKKMFSEMIQGTGYFYDSKMGRRITAFRLVIGLISDGEIYIPIFLDYLFDQELLEACHRRLKQYLGLNDCMSKSFTRHQNHVAATFVAFALAQLDKQKYKLKTPGEAIRRLGTKSQYYLKRHFAFIFQENNCVYS